MRALYLAMGREGEERAKERTKIYLIPIGSSCTALNACYVTTSPRPLIINISCYNFEVYDWLIRMYVSIMKITDSSTKYCGQSL